MSTHAKTHTAYPYTKIPDIRLVENGSFKYRDSPNHKSAQINHCREIARNRGKRGYRSKQAYKFAIEGRDKAKRRITTAAWEMIDQLIKLDWSPEQISDHLGKEQRLRISHEWIYQYIYQDKRSGWTLWRHLRYRKKRRKHYGNYEKRGQIPNRVWIDKRPMVID